MSFNGERLFGFWLLSWFLKRFRELRTCMDLNNAGIGPLSVSQARYIFVRGPQGSVFPARFTSMIAPHRAREHVMLFNKLKSPISYGNSPENSFLPSFLRTNCFGWVAQIDFWPCRFPGPFPLKTIESQINYGIEYWLCFNSLLIINLKIKFYSVNNNMFIVWLKKGFIIYWSNI